MGTRVAIGDFSKMTHLSVKALRHYHDVGLLVPLVADLAPAALRGRYMAAIGLSWWLALALAPTLGTQLLGASPPAALLAAAGVALGAGISALTLDKRLPPAIRLTPRPVAGTRPPG